MTARVASEQVTAASQGDAQIARAPAGAEPAVLPVPARASASPASVLALQRAAGNRATVSALASRHRLLQRQPVAVADADAEDVHRLLFEPDPVAGMRTAEAIH